MHYGRLMDEVEQAATESCKDRVSVARNTPRRLHYFNDSSFILVNTSVKPTIIARNLGVMMNQDFSMRSHINKLVQSCFYSLRQIRSIRRSLSFDEARKLICIVWFTRVSTTVTVSAQDYRHNLSTVCNRSSMLPSVWHAVYISTIT